MGQSEEDQVVELVAWLEIATEEGSPGRNFKDLINRHHKSCTRTEVVGEFSELGLSIVRFWFPLSELAKVFQFDQETLANWLGAVAVDYLNLRIVDDKQYGPCVLASRYEHIPTDKRPKHPKVELSDEAKALNAELRRRLT